MNAEIESFSEKTMASNRPLSPHLQIYRWQQTMAMSILHRITGCALCVGTLLLAWWLIAAMLGEAQYNVAKDFAGSPLGLFMLFGWSFCLYYHLFNGIRHLIWDTVHLLKMRNAFIAGCVVLLLTILATGGTWYYAYKNHNVAPPQLDNLAQQQEEGALQ